MTKEEESFFNIYQGYYGNTYEIESFQKRYFVLIAHTKFDEKNLEKFAEKSKAGRALEKYLKYGKRSDLEPSERNILYKLKAENITEIERKIKEKEEFLRAKIECIKLLKVLDYGKKKIKLANNSLHSIYSLHY